MTPEPPSIDAESVPWLTVDQMAEADRLAVEEFGIDLLQMMEHAGSALAELTDGLYPTGRITVVAGGGNNGGGGLCSARHLVNKGRRVTVVMLADLPGPAAAHHLRTLAAMGVDPASEPGPADVVIDAMVGYGLEGPLRGRAADIAAWIGRRHVVSLDFPSGHGFPRAVQADATLTLALPKEGLRDVRPLWLADLGLPAALWARMGIDVAPVFAGGRIARIVDREAEEPASG